MPRSASVHPAKQEVVTAPAPAAMRARIFLCVLSALLLILSFPNFDLWPIAWIGLAPLLVAAARSAKRLQALLLGWVWGIVFYYGTCWWLTYPMIRYANVPPWLAYPLLILPVALVAIFPGLFAAVVCTATSRFGSTALLAAPIVWISVDWARYVVTGQLWNALGYSQAFHPTMLHPARWGGVYLITLLIVITNTAVALVWVRLTFRSAGVAVGLVVVVGIVIAASSLNSRSHSNDVAATVIAVQPNVPMNGADDPSTMNGLLNQHLQLSIKGLAATTIPTNSARLVIWPESPMTFSYTRDPHLRQVVAAFARDDQTAVLLNSLEPAPNGGDYNSAVLINQKGAIAAQYDKIRLMPFGEYVPLPRWLPGASSVRAIVGEFTPGSSYPLMPLGDLRAGVFICIEAAHPEIARAFSDEGADVLINISNDGYLGPTPVMRQHLSNAIFRAVENNRPLIRVTNSGITGFMDGSGKVFDATTGFQPAVRVWQLPNEHRARTFYSLHGDLLAYICVLASLAIIVAAVATGKRSRSAAG